MKKTQMTTTSPSSSEKDDDLLVKLAAHLGRHLEGAESLINGLREVLDRTQNPGTSANRPSEEVWLECNRLCHAAGTALTAWQRRSDLLSVLIRLQREASARDKTSGGST